MNRVGVPSTWPEARPLLNVALDPLQHRRASPVAVEGRYVQPELGGVPAQVAVFERLLAVEQQLVHVPEPALPGSGLGRAGRGEGVRVNLGQREMPEREPHVPAELPFDLLDRVVRLPRVRALVIAVLDDQTADGRTPDVIDFLIWWRQGQLAVVRHRAVGHGGFRWPLNRLEPDLLADEDDVDAAGELLMNLQDLPDLAVLPVGRLRARIL